MKKVKCSSAGGGIKGDLRRNVRVEPPQSSALWLLRPTRGRGTVSRRELQPETTAAPESRFDTAGATHLFQRTGHNSQPDAGAFNVLDPADALENPENLFVRFRRDANAVVF